MARDRYFENESKSVTPQELLIAAGPQSQIPEIEAALKSGDLRAAMTLAADRAGAGPNQADGLLLVTQFLTSAEKWQILADFLTPHIDRFPTETALHWAIGQAYTQVSQPAKAEPYLRRVATNSPDWPRVHYYLGRNLYHAGRQDEAIAFLQDAVRMEPSNAKAHYLLSVCLASEGRYAEALPAMRTVTELQPTGIEAQWHRQDLEEIAKAPPTPNVFARWPNAAREFDDVGALTEKYVTKNFPTAGLKLRPKMGVFTQGSCFAENLATSLQRYDLQVDYMPCGEEHNNTFANRVVIEWLRYGGHNGNTAIIDAKLGKEMRERYLAALRNADVFVYTMGIAAVHFDRITGEFIMSRPTETNKAALFKRSEFRTSTVQQNVDNLLHILAGVRELAPKAAIVLTVSPVPLRAATEFNSAIIADCLSKSTLRVAIHEVMAHHPPRTIYWPSFEMVRWLGGHMDGRVYGADDGSAHHVNQSHVNHIIDSFVHTFGEDDLLATRR